MPCVPDAISVPSRKLKVTIRGTFQPGVGTGTGYVIFNPWLAVVNDGALAGGNNNFPIVFTGSTYNGAAGTYVQAVAAGAFTTVGLNGQNSNSPYTTANFTTNLWQYRLVGSGLKAKYLGDDFHNAGRFIIFRDEGNASVQSNTTVATMLNDVYTNTMPVKMATPVAITAPITGWAGTSYYAISAYQGFTPNLSRFCQLIMLDGMDTVTPQSCEFEAVAFFEIIGRNLDTTPSEADPLGHSAVSSAISQMVHAPIKPPEVVEQTILQTATNYLRDNLSSSIPTIVNVGGQVLAGAARSYFGSGNNLPRISGGPTITEL